MPVTVCSGLACYDPRFPEGDLLAHSLIALAAAQRKGAGSLVEFSPEMRAAALQEGDMRAGLDQAVRDGGFVLHYQPVVLLVDQAPVAAEALVRWVRPDGTLVRPDLFIPFAERTGQIVPLGRWALRQALADCAGWPRAEGWYERPPPRANVNVSPVQLREPGFLDELRTVLAEADVPPSRLAVEVTETGIVQQHGILGQVRALGTSVAMDDFGTGYSSLSSLRQLPITTMKIDKSFVDRIADDPVQYSLVEGIIRMAGELNLGTVAEGVETAGQQDRLLAAGCQCGQGYLYAKPLPNEEFIAWLRRWTGKHAPSGDFDGGLTEG
jgi:EAL domain-containing protein (putative c-di-GMP-specific phosphodiesterase class I)